MPSAGAFQQVAKSSAEKFLLDERRRIELPASPGRAVSASAAEMISRCPLSAAIAPANRLYISAKQTPALKSGKQPTSSKRGSGTFATSQLTPKSQLFSTSSSKLQNKSNSILLQDTFLPTSDIEPSFLSSRSSALHGSLWPKKARIYRTIHRVLDDGSDWVARIMDLCPWTWRHHPMQHYALTSDIEKMQTLFELGYRDAYDHRDQLLAFFEDANFLDNDEEYAEDDELSKMPNFEFFDVYPVENTRTTSTGSLSAVRANRTDN